mgnify:CR=1 FL=1
MARVAVVSALLLAVGAGVTVARGSRVAAAGTESVGRSPTAPGRQHEDRTRNAPEAAPAPPVPDHPDRLVFPPRAIEIPRAEPVTHRLSNGTAVIVVDASLPLVEIAVALRAGSYLDPDDAPGLAELTGALVRRGGTTERDADLFDEAVDALGAEIDTRAGGTRAGATLDCLAETLEASLDLFFEMLRQPAF